ncbi:hypothetical protein AAC387_Pa10g1249 [Persea americana]
MPHTKLLLPYPFSFQNFSLHIPSFPKYPNPLHPHFLFQHPLFPLSPLPAASCPLSLSLSLPLPLRLSFSLSLSLSLPPPPYLPTSPSLPVPTAALSPFPRPSPPPAMLPRGRWWLGNAGRAG